MRPFSALSLLPLLVAACQTEKAGYHNRPLRSSADVANTTSDTNYLRIRQRTFSKKLLLVDKQKQRQLVSGDSLWGYETKNGERYRYFNRGYYKIEELSAPAIYSITFWVPANSAISQYAHYQTNYFFSKNSDSEIFTLSKRNVRRVFQDDPAFLERLAARRWRLYDRKAKPVLNQVYEEAHRM